MNIHVDRRLLHVLLLLKFSWSSTLDLRILKSVLPTSQVVYHASIPKKLVVYCFFIIIQKTRDFSMSLVAQ